jgi:hypothetical protein
MEEVLGQRLLLAQSSVVDRAARSINQFIAKKAVRSFSFGKDKDRVRQEERQNYTDFPGQHEGVTVILYRTPECGWEASVSERSMALDKDSQTGNNESSGLHTHRYRGIKSADRRPFDVKELIKTLEL